MNIKRYYNHIVIKMGNYLKNVVEISCCVCHKKAASISNLVSSIS